MANDPSDDFLQTRLSLLERLRNWEDNESWREFLAIYGGLLHSVALRSGLTEAEAQDAIQETVISVAKTMPGFKYDRSACAFKTWLQHLALKRIADQFRKRSPAAKVAAPSAHPPPELLEQVPDPQSLELDAVWNTEWQKYIFDAAVRRVKSQASVEQFQIFDFYVLKEWPIKQVMSALGVSAARVYLAKHRVMRLVKQEAKRLEKKGI